MRKLVVPSVGLILALGLLFSARMAVAAGVSSPALAGWTAMATLSGAEEVPQQGDADGQGTATVRLGSSANEVCYEMQVSNITLPAAAAHIHRGARGVAGDVVVPLTAPDANGRASGCTNADADLLGAINANPENFYVNVHTSDFPAGAVRGQLMMQAGTGAPATTMPATGAGSGTMALLTGLALLALLAGLGLNWRRQTAR